MRSRESPLKFYAILSVSLWAPFFKYSWRRSCSVGYLPNFGFSLPFLFLSDTLGIVIRGVSDLPANGILAVSCNFAVTFSIES